MLSRVDLPQPLGPMTATISFCAMVRLMSRTASTNSSLLPERLRDMPQVDHGSRPLEDRALVAAIDVDIGADR